MPAQFLWLAVGTVVSFSVGHVSVSGCPRGTAFEALGKGLSEGLPVALFLRVESRRALFRALNHTVPGYVQRLMLPYLKKNSLIFA